jgi:thioredoxin reductase
MFDVTVIGAGPAGCSAALILARMNRAVRLLDTADGRNATAEGVHGHVTTDGGSVREWRERALRDVCGYPTVYFDEIAVDSVLPADEEFAITTRDRQQTKSRRVILATGIQDVVSLPGAASLWGRGVFQCPLCHAWEVRDRPIGIIGGDHRAATVALELSNVASSISIYGPGPPEFDEDMQGALQSISVKYHEDPVVEVSSLRPGTVLAHTAGGAAEEFAAVFVQATRQQRSGIPQSIGCAFTETGQVHIDRLNRTSVPGVFAAGDLARNPESPGAVSMVTFAMADGCRAGIAVHNDLAFSAAFGGLNPD